MNVKKMILLMAVMGLILSHFSGYAQNHLIKIGDFVPDLRLGEFLFYKQPYQQLSELKGKLVIFDFWDSSCAPCIKAMPKYDGLQKQFGDRIVILPIVNKKNDTSVSRADFEKAKAFYSSLWRKNSYTNRTSLPTIIDTTGLRWKFTEIKGVPFQIWINRDGKLIGTTQSINEKEIKSVLEKNQLGLDSKFSDTIKYDRSKPLLKFYNDQISETLYYTAITPFLKYEWGKNTNYEYDSVKNATRFSLINKPIMIGLLISKAKLYERLGSGAENRILLEVKDTSLYLASKDEYLENWIRKTYHSYEAIVPGEISKNEMNNKMNKDVADFLNVDTKFEKRTVDCWALVRTSSNNDLLISSKKENLGKRGKFNSPDHLYYTKDTKSVTSTFTTINNLVDELNFMISYEEPELTKSSSRPILDETGISHMVRILIDRLVIDGEIDPKASYNYNYLKCQLNKYGLDLIPVKREIEVFVIKDKDYKKNT